MNPKIIKAIGKLMGSSTNIIALAEQMVKLGIGSFAECYELGVDALNEMSAACHDSGGDCFFCRREMECPASTWIGSEA